SKATNISRSEAFMRTGKPRPAARASGQGRKRTTRPASRAGRGRRVRRRPRSQPAPEQPGAPGRVHQAGGPGGAVRPRPDGGHVRGAPRGVGADHRARGAAVIAVVADDLPMIRVIVYPIDEKPRVTYLAQDLGGSHRAALETLLRGAPRSGGPSTT